MSIFERLLRGEVTAAEYVADVKRRVRERREGPGQSCHCWTLEGGVPVKHADWCPVSRSSGGTETRRNAD